MFNDTTTYTVRDLRTEAQHGLRGAQCFGGTRAHQIRLKAFEIMIRTTHSGDAVSLHVVGECTKHHTSIHRYCTL